MASDKALFSCDDTVFGRHDHIRIKSEPALSDRGFASAERDTTRTRVPVDGPVTNRDIDCSSKSLLANKSKSMSTFTKGNYRSPSAKHHKAAKEKIINQMPNSDNLGVQSLGSKKRRRLMTSPEETESKKKRMAEAGIRLYEKNGLRAHNNCCKNQKSVNRNDRSDVFKDDYNEDIDTDASANFCDDGKSLRCGSHKKVRKDPEGQAFTMKPSFDSHAYKMSKPRHRFCIETEFRQVLLLNGKEDEDLVRKQPTERIVGTNTNVERFKTCANDLVKALSSDDFVKVLECQENLDTCVNELTAPFMEMKRCSDSMRTPQMSVCVNDFMQASEVPSNETEKSNSGERDASFNTKTDPDGRKAVLSRAKNVRILLALSPERRMTTAST